MGVVLIHLSIKWQYMYKSFQIFILGKRFYFRGCGWSATQKTTEWTTEHKDWVEAMNQLFELIFGKDHLTYEYDQNKTCVVADDDIPKLDYEHSLWEEIYRTMIRSFDLEKINNTFFQEKTKRASSQKEMQEKIVKKIQKAYLW